jgi:transposase InsO family protein
MEKQALFPQLKLDSYNVWSKKAALIIKGLGAKGLIGQAKEMQPKIEDKDMALDDKIHAAICLSIPDEIFSLVDGTSTSHQAWFALKDRFGESGVQSVMNAIKELFTSSQDCLSITEYIAQVEMRAQHVQAIASEHIQVSDSLKGMIILMGVSKEYKPIIDSIDATSTDIKAGNVEAILIRNEKRNTEKNTKRDTSDDMFSALQAEVTALRAMVNQGNRPKWCSFCRKPISECYKPNCFNLHPELKSSRNKGNKASELFAYPALSSYDSKYSEWLIDSGCNRHIVRDDALLTNTEKNTNTVSITLGNDQVVHSSVAGTSYVKLGDQLATVADTIVAPNFGVNLLSIGVSTSRGLKFWFDGDICEIYKEVDHSPRGEKLCTVIKSNDLYRLQGINMESPPIRANYVSRQENATLERWHQRMKHGNYVSLKKLLDGAASGIKIDGNLRRPEKLCEGCILGKMTRGRFPKRLESSKATKVLQCVYSDVCGPFPVSASGSNARYFILFVDEYSRYIWVYFLKDKASVHDAVLKFVTESRRFTGKGIDEVITLQTDNAGEYVSNIAKEFYEKQGIIHRTSVPYDHEQQGMAERPNRTILEAAEAMRHHAGLKAEFWGDAVATSVYLYNRFPHSQLKHKTPHEIWFGKIPNISHCRVFGCKAFVHQQNRHQIKLTPRAFSAIFIGYQNRQKAYRLWDPTRNKFIISRDVIFMEDDFSLNTSLSQNNQQDKIDLGSVLLDTGSRESIGVEEIRMASDDAIQDNSCPEIDASSSSNEYQEPEQGQAGTELRRSSRLRFLPGEWWKANSAFAKSDDEKLTHAGMENADLEVGRLKNVSNRENLVDSACHKSLTVRSNAADSKPNLARLHGVLAKSVPIPADLSQALSSPFALFWNDAANEEFNNLIKMGTWNLTVKPPDRKAISCKWVFSVKAKANGNIEKFKARLVVKGFSQRPGIDFDETFCPVAHSETQRLMMANAVKFKLKLRQADVVSAFLNGEIDTEVFMKQPEGFEDPLLTDHVCLLQKGLYGLKQAGHLWNKKLDNFITNSLSMTKSLSDPCLYYKNKEQSTILLSLHVDDMLFAHNDDNEVERMLTCLNDAFGIKDLGEPEKILGVRIRRDKDTGSIYLDQQLYIEDTIARFEMTNCDIRKTPHQPGLFLTDKMCPNTNEEKQTMEGRPYRELVGSLNYIATRTRPDITHAVSNLCRFMSNPGNEHWSAAKHVLRYLKGTSSFGIVYSSDQDIEGFADSDYAGDLDRRRSTTGYIFQMSAGPISWKSQLQKSTAQSALESEYMALCAATREAAWIKELLRESTNRRNMPILINGDNQGCQAIAQNRRTDARTKHIDVRYHYTRDKVEDGTIALKYCPTDAMLADFLTKPISTAKFLWCRSAIGVKDVGSRGRVEIESDPTCESNDKTLNAQDKQSKLRSPGVYSENSPDSLFVD